MSADLERYCQKIGATQIKRAPEESKHNARIESEVGSWKTLAGKVIQACHITKADDAWSWVSQITKTSNQFLKYDGFSPNQSEFGKEPRIPDGILTDEQNRVVVQRRMTMDSGARRVEHIRRTAEVEMQKLDDVTTLSEAMARRLKHNHSPGYSKGDIVYYCRNVTSKSAIQSRVHGWRGPCILLDKEGLRRIYVGTYGSVILVLPEQLRHASLDEMLAMESMEDMARAMGDDLATKQQMGYLDERGPGPGPEDEARASGPDVLRVPADR